ncbi:mucin-binding protein, partial [Lactobacillus crispatus]|uniref:mucin-binding protein n=3 Tax=Lactobacillus crispatus TaxID=47770 RepID=UPI00123AB7FC
MLERVPKYTLRKLSVGLASVMIGSGILMNSPKVLADTNDTSTASSQIEDNSNPNTQSGAIQDKDNSKPSTQSGATQDKDNSKSSTQSSATQDKNNAAVQERSDKSVTETPTKPGNNDETPLSENKLKLAKTLAELPASAKVPAPKPTTAYATYSDWSDLTKGKGIAYYTANDDATTTTGVYNNPDATSSDWLKLANGKAIVYYTAKGKGKDGKTYVTGYVGEGSKSQSVFDVDQIDPDSLEYHFIYHQDNNANNYGVWFNFAEDKKIEVDGRRIDSNGLKLKSKDGNSYNWSMNGVGDGGLYYSYADYLKNHNNSLEKATQISLTGAKVKAGDTIEMTIPVKYVGELSDTQPSLDFSPHVDEYFDNGTRLIQHWSTLYFTTVRQVELHPAQIETPAKPTTDKYTVTTGIYNDPQITTSDWINMVHGKAIAYYTAKGKDGKTYVTGYVAANGKSQSIINVKQIDLSTLEYHLIYHNGDKEVGSGLWANFADNKTIAIDTSRLGADGPQLKSQQGWSYKWTINGPKDGGNYYNSWAEYLKAHNNVGDQATNISMTGVAIKPDDMVEFVIPVKYIGQLSASTPSLTFSPHINDYGKGFDQNWADLYFTSGAQIETPAKPTTDKDTVTTGIYNNPQRTTSDWIKMTHGDAIGYYTAKGKDGKTYVTGYVAANGNSQSIFNVDQIDLNSLEYHLIYHNGDKEVGSGLWFNFADGKTLQLDTSRLGADGPQLKSQQGWSYKWSINTGADQGIYYNSWAEYLKAHNNVGDQASQISMTGVAIKPDDTIEFNIPVKYNGQLSARTPYLAFSPHINDYGNGFTQNWADLYFTTVKKDLSEVKRVVLLPTEFMGEKPGESDWKLVKEISKDMPNGWDTFKISNFRTYKGSFNMDSLPKGDLPSLVYGSAQYFIDLSKIQEIFANHGYTVKYANNNGKAQEMPFYAYSTIPLAKRVDDDRPVLNDPSIWVIQVQAVPAIILNKDQHYVADPNAKPWDTTSMIDEIYAADDAGNRVTRDQLGKLPKTDVDISYEYQATGAATAVAVDKVDLTKAGVYTVTYSHTYANGQVVKDSRKVYVDDVKQENKKITRTIIVHTPNGTDQTVIQTATLTRESILDATTGEIKSLGKWSTAKWETYLAPKFKGYTPSPAQIDETAVNKDTQDTTVEISYTANETS